MKVCTAKLVCNGVELVRGVNWSEAETASAQCNDCRRFRARARYRFCTINMPDGTVEDWVRYVVNLTSIYTDRGGEIIARWWQDRPDSGKWPKRKEMLKGVLAKSNGKPTLKTCKTCKETKPVGAFSWRSGSGQKVRDLQIHCKNCAQDKQSELNPRDNAISRIMHQRMGDQGIPRKNHYDDGHTALRKRLRKEIEADGSWQKKPAEPEAPLKLVVDNTAEEEPNKQVEPEEDAKPPKYEGFTWESPLDSKLAEMKPTIVLPRRGPMRSTEGVADYGTTKDNAPTFQERDEQPGILYMIRPCPWVPWWIKVGMMGAQGVGPRLRSDYEKGMPPGPERNAMDFDCLGYMTRGIASGERHLIQEVSKYATRDRKEFFLFSRKQAPKIDDLIWRIIFEDIGADLYNFYKESDC